MLKFSVHTVSGEPGNHNLGFFCALRAQGPKVSRLWCAEVKLKQQRAGLAGFAKTKHG